jgi:hypothetical protein
MKKTLLLSIVAASAVMAGGNVAAPVAPVVAAASAWEFTGAAKVYFQTDNAGLVVNSSNVAGHDLFDQSSNAAAAGLQLGATNADLFAGIGAGVQVSGISSLSLEQDMVTGLMQSGNGGLTGSWISQAYLTYGIGNTSVKVGRQELPQSLSPMAYSETWNVFANTYDGVVAVNTDIQDTTVVAAFVQRMNSNAMGSNMSDFSDLTTTTDGAYMLTVQNKSIENVTLTGTVYQINDFTATDDLTIYWGDVQTAVSGVNVGLQAMDANGASEGRAYGVKLGTDVAGYTVGAAYTKASNGWYNHALGGTTGSLYTTTALDQVVNDNTTKYTNEEKYVISASRAAFGGNATLAYADSKNSAVDYTEYDAVYSTDLTSNINLAAAYVYADMEGDNVDLVRVVASYKF